MFLSYDMFYKSIVDLDYMPNMSFGMVAFDDKFDKMWLSRNTNKVVVRFPTSNSVIGTS